jgi:hypothetical protein
MLHRLNHTDFETNGKTWRSRSSKKDFSYKTHTKNRNKSTIIVVHIYKHEYKTFFEEFSNLKHNLLLYEKILYSFIEKNIFSLFNNNFYESKEKKYQIEKITIPSN